VQQYADGLAAGKRASISPEGLLNVHTIESAFKVLQTYSLVQWKQEQESYSMHKLVHAVGLCFHSDFGPPNVHLSSSPDAVRKRCEYV